MKNFSEKTLEAVKRVFTPSRVDSVDAIVLQRAVGVIEHRNASGKLLWKGKTKNLITNVGRVQYHTQCFATAGLATNGNNYIGLSNDTVTETAASTVITNEIIANGLTRAQGTVTLATGAGNQTTIAKTFTCATAPQAAQKAALFNLVAAGTMNHVLGFTQRSLQIGDTLTVTFTITLG
jgi:hypothetical protein